MSMRIVELLTEKAERQLNRISSKRINKHDLSISIKNTDYMEYDNGAFDTDYITEDTTIKI